MENYALNAAQPIMLPNNPRFWIDADTFAFVGLGKCDHLFDVQIAASVAAVWWYWEHRRLSFRFETECRQFEENGTGEEEYKKVDAAEDQYFLWLKLARDGLSKGALEIVAYQE